MLLSQSRVVGGNCSGKFALNLVLRVCMHHRGLNVTIDSSFTSTKHLYLVSYLALGSSNNVDLAPKDSLDLSRCKLRDDCVTIIRKRTLCEPVLRVGGPLKLDVETQRARRRGYQANGQYVGAISRQVFLSK
jgi:hypothetical protein